MNKFHSFNTDDAQLHGIEKALILQHMRHWLDLHQAENKHAHKYLKTGSDHYNRNFYWTFFTARGLQKILPYLGDPQKIHRLLRELEEKGIIISDTLSENKQNRTKSYSIPLEYPCLKNETSSLKNETSSLKNETCYRSNNISNNITNKYIPETQIQVSNDPLPSSPSQVYLDIAKSIGLSKNIELVYQQFLGHLQSKNCSNLPYHQKRGKWQTYLATAKLHKTISDTRANHKQSSNYDPLGINDTTWASEFNEELKNEDSF